MHALVSELKQFRREKLQWKSFRSCHSDWTR